MILTVLFPDAVAETMNSAVAFLNDKWDALMWRISTSTIGGGFIELWYYGTYNFDNWRHHSKENLKHVGRNVDFILKAISHAIDSWMKDFGDAMGHLMDVVFSPIVHTLDFFIKKIHHFMRHLDKKLGFGFWLHDLLEAVA